MSLLVTVGNTANVSSYAVARNLLGLCAPPLSNSEEACRPRQFTSDATSESEGIGTCDPRALGIESTTCDVPSQPNLLPPATPLPSSAWADQEAFGLSLCSLSGPDSWYQFYQDENTALSGTTACQAFSGP